MSKIYRDYGPALLMLVVSLVLLLVLAGEWLHFRNQRAELKARLTSTEAVAPPASEGTVGDFTLPEVDQFAEMVQRPLFMEGRRPPPEDLQAASQDAPAEQKPLNMKLMGVVFTPKEKTALLVDDKGKYRRLRKNAVVDGWRLTEVREDRVVMEQGSVPKELPLLKPKPKVAKPPRPVKSGKAEIRGPDDAGGGSGEVEEPENFAEPGAEAEEGSDQGEVSDESDPSEQSEVIEETELPDETSEIIEEPTEDASEIDEGSDVQEE